MIVLYLSGPPAVIDLIDQSLLNAARSPIEGIAGITHKVRSLVSRHDTESTPEVLKRVALLLGDAATN